MNNEERGLTGRDSQGGSRGNTAGKGINERCDLKGVVKKDHGTLTGGGGPKVFINPQISFYLLLIFF